MAGATVSLASGTEVELHYCLEADRNVTPAGLGTLITGISATANGNGTATFTKTGTTWLANGVTAGQKIRISGFVSNTVNNADWRVISVSGQNIVVYDPNDTIVTESASAGARILLQKFRGTSRDVNLAKDELTSAEIDGDGQETDVRHGFRRVEGNLGMQVQLQDCDDMFELLAQNRFVRNIGVTSAPVLSAAAGASNQFVRDAGSFITDGFRVGDIITTTGFAETINNGQWRVLAVTALALTVSDEDGIIVTETAAPSAADIVVTGKRLDVGGDLCTFLLQRVFADVGIYQVFNGCGIGQADFAITPDSIVTAGFTIVGISAADNAASSVATAAPLETYARQPMAAFDGSAWEGGTETFVMTSLNFSLNRGLSLRGRVGSTTSPDLFKSQATGTGTAQFFLQNAALLNKFYGETESYIWVRLDDPADPTQFVNIVLPRVKYNSAPMAPEQEGPVLQDMSFRFLKKTGLAAPGGTTVNSMMTIQVSNDLLA